MYPIISTRTIPPTPGLTFIEAYCNNVHGSSFLAPPNWWRVESEDPDDDIIAAKIVGVHDANTDGISADHSVPCAQDGDVFSISRPTRQVR